MPLDSSSHVENSPSLGHFSLQTEQGNRTGAQSKKHDKNEQSSWFSGQSAPFGQCLNVFLWSLGSFLKNLGISWHFRPFLVNYCRIKEFPSAKNLSCWLFDRYQVCLRPSDSGAFLLGSSGTFSELLASVQLPFIQQFCPINHVNVSKGRGHDGPWRR